MVESIPDIFNYIYVLLVFSIILYSMMVNHNNRKFKKIYYFASFLFGVYGIIVIVILGFNTYHIIFDSDISSFIIPIFYLRLLIVLVILGHALPILLTFSPKKYIECISSLPGYVFYIPTYINILQTFAFCRVDDLSWGTKGIDSTDSNLVR